MSSEVEDLFDAARRLKKPAQRQAFLDAACQDNPGLRRELEELLTLQPDAEGLLEPGIARLDPEADNLSQLVPTLAAAGVAQEQIGDRVDRYKLREKIGEGGCGVVYVADQEQPVRRRVALKVIKVGMDTKSVIARFDAERQALAIMDHPSIAKVLDAGATATGRPYFVMELVRGIKITEFCDQNRLTTEQRLELFIKVCQAVQHAHQKGIIHRDLKPSNILVTLNDGVAVPKVIDFGIAKATEGRLTDLTIYTELNQLIGTPAYMSPEQALMTCVDIDTRSDIYSLGVLLYELLTGKPPFDNKELMTLGLDEMRRTIREREPLRPSTRLSTLSYGELDTTAKARGIEAPRLCCLVRGDLDWIVMKCLEKDRARRYETANGLATDLGRYLAKEAVMACPPSPLYRFRKTLRRNRLAFVAGTAVLGALLAGLAIAAWQAARARAEAQAAREVKEFLIRELVGTADPYTEPQPDPNKRPLLERIARQLEGKFPHQPTVEADLRDRLAWSFSSLGEFAQAVAEGEKCLAIRRRVLGPVHTDTLEAIANLAYCYMGLGRGADAKKLLTEGLDAMGDPRKRNSMGAAWVLWVQGLWLAREGRSAEALRFQKPGLVLLKLRLDPEDPLRQTLVGLMAYTVFESGQQEEAVALVAEARKESERQHGSEHPASTDLAVIQADLLLARGQWQEALPLLQHALPIQRRLLGADHANTLDAEFLLGRAYEGKGDLEEAARHYASWPGRFSKYLSAPDRRRKCLEVALFFARQRRLEQAKAVYSALWPFFEAKPPQNAQELGILFEVANAVGSTNEVEVLYGKALATFPQNPSVWGAGADFFGGQGRWKQAADHAFKAIEYEPTNHWHYHLLAPALVAAGDLEGYRQLCRQILDRFAGATDPTTAERMGKDCLILPSSGADLHLVAKMIDTAMAAGTNHEYWTWFRFAKGLAEYRQEHWEGAEQWTQQVLADPERISKRDLGAYAVLAMTYQKSNRPSQARASLAKAMELAESKLPRLGEPEFADGWGDWVIGQALLAEAKDLCAETYVH